MARRLGVPYTGSWDEVYEWLPQGVVVTSEVSRHRELIERAAEAEAQVLCEHPLATTEADAKAIADACDIGGVLLMLASPACFGGAFAAVRRGIADGALGTLTTMLGSHATRAPAGQDADCGELDAGAAQLLDLADMVLGGEPAEQVYAQSNSVLRGQPGAASAALMTVRYPGGKVAAIDCGWNPAAAGGPTMTFIGDRASVEYDACPRLLGGFDAATATQRRESGGEDLDLVMLRDFIAAFESGQGAGPDGAAGLRSIRIIRAARESARTGQPVSVG